MKKIVIIAGFLLNISWVFAQCPPGDITFSSQMDIDAFADNFPDCNIISGKLIINGADIVDLSGLAQIQVAEAIAIYENSSLVTLEGLSEIELLGSYRFVAITDNPLLQSADGSFVTNNNNYIEGAVNISNNPLLNSIGVLSGLKSITRLEITNNDTLSNIDNAFTDLVLVGNLIITENEMLQNLEGLVNINVSGFGAGADFFISDNPSLETFGFGLLSSGSNFSTMNIINNDSLLSLDGIGVCTLTGVLSIMDNDSLENISALEAFQNTIDTSLRLWNNPLLTDISGLSFIDQTGQFFEIINNDSLQNLDGLENLLATFYSTAFKIENNDNLYDITALSDFVIEEIQSISIIENPQLSVCNVPAFCDFVNSGGDIVISGNAPGCSDEIELINTCAQCPLGDIFINSQSEIDNFSFAYPMCTDIGADLLISGNDITNLQGFNNIATISGTLRISGNPMLQSLSGLEGLNSSQAIEIIDNVILDNVSSLANLTELVSLNIEQNPALTSLSGFESLQLLESINIEDNMSLENLNGLEQLQSLTHLTLKNNAQLLELSAFANLSGSVQSVSIIENSILPNLDGLQGIYAISEMLTIRGNTALENISGLQGVNNMGYPQNLNVSIELNDSLHSIYGIQFINEQSLESIEIVNNSSLGQCSILSVCAAITNGNTVIISSNNAGCNSLAEVEDSCGSSLNSIFGNVSFDMGNNDCLSDTTQASNVMISMIDDSGAEISTITQNDGSYFMPVGLGTYAIDVKDESLPEGFSSNPESANITFDTNGTMDSANFCVFSNTAFLDVGVSILPQTAVRPGFTSTYLIVFENKGTNTISGEIDFEFENERQQFEQATPIQSSISGNIISWQYEDLVPFEIRTIEVLLYNYEPPINTGGEILGLQATIYPTIDDMEIDSNFSDLYQIIVNSFDPNDKSVLQGPEIYEEDLSDYLDYIIRFQNTGTASAITVKVTDTLSDNLQWDTFRTLSSSHEYRVEIVDGNAVSFIFDDINLPPESIDPEGSNGFIAFQVRPEQTLDVGDIIENTAQIYFDFNAPIITNTVETEIVEPLGIKNNLLSNTVLLPNPVDESFRIKIDNALKLKQGHVISLLGKNLFTFTSPEVDVSFLKSGVYFVKIQTDQGTITKKIVKE